jgi:CTP synthase
MDKFINSNLVVSGFNKELNLVEIIELKDHPFFIACQYHPEFKSKPFSPHPMFKAFIEEADKFDICK